MNSRKIMLGVALFAFCVQADTEIVDGVEWKFSGTDGKVTIEGIVGDLPESGKIVVPMKLGGWPVCALGWGALSNCKTLRSIEIPISVSEVRGGCFRGCENLETVVIAALIDNLNDGLFHGCKRLKTIKLPAEMLLTNRPMRLGCQGFVVGREAFRDCYSLERIVLPDNVGSISVRLFENCYLLKEVHYPKMLRSVGSEAFHQCYSLEEVALPDGVERMAGAFCRCTQLRNFIVPASVKEIDSSFEECFRLEKIVFRGAAPKGLSSHWFYGADVYCYADHAASYTNANPNLIVKSPRVPLKELCGVTFTNAENLVLLVDEKAAARAKANSKRWEELDAEASKALEEARKVSAEDCAQRVRDAARQKKEKQEAINELAGWPKPFAPFVFWKVSVYGTNVDEVVRRCCDGACISIDARSPQSTSVELISICSKACNVVFPAVTREDASSRVWEANGGACLIDAEFGPKRMGYYSNEKLWKKYDESGRLIKWGDRTKFEEYVWITNQHAVVSARLKEEWAKKHGLTLEQAEKRTEELRGDVDSGSGLLRGSPGAVRLLGAQQTQNERPSSVLPSSSLRARRQRRQQQAQEGERKADEAAAKREAERQAQAEAAKAQRDVEREQQRQQLLAIQEELKRTREAKAAERK